MKLPAFASFLFLLPAAGRCAAQHTAYVFRTDTNPVPLEVMDAINAYGGPGTVIVEFGPGVGPFLNGVPVATVAVNAAKNAGLLAAQILAVSDAGLLEKISAYKNQMRVEVEAKAARMEQLAVGGGQ